MVSRHEIERMRTALRAAAERERKIRADTIEECAKVCEEREDHYVETNRLRAPGMQFLAEQGCGDCVSAIRAITKE
jgi:hypothetical protein